MTAKNHLPYWLIAISLFSFLMLYIPAYAQTNNAANVAQQIYAQCMRSPDANLPDGQQKYCSCTAQQLSAQMSTTDMATLAGNAGQNASQDDISKAMMADPRFSGIIQQCLAQALGNSR